MDRPDEFVTPPPVDPGDRVAVIAPASGLAATYPEVYERGLDRLREFGLEPVEFPTATAEDDYLAAHPEKRAADVEAAFADPSIGAAIATIGGNDQVRVLKHLDGDRLAANPTRFLGSSDNTHLAGFLWARGVVTFHGGDLMTEFGAPGPLTDYHESALRTALFGDPAGPVEPAPAFTDEDLDWNDPENLARTPEYEDNPGPTFHGDHAVTGRLWGGNLAATYTQLAADRFLPPADALDGAVLLLETSEELPGAGAVRRALMAAGERGLLDRVGAVLFGRVKARSPTVERSRAEREAYRERLRGTVREVLADYAPGTPVVTGVDVGHTRPAVPLPLGRRVSVDPGAGRLVVEG